MGSRNFIFIFSLLLSSFKTYSQSNPQFSKFNGEVIYLEEEWQPKYGSHVHSANVIATVSWDELNISAKSSSKPFNGHNFGNRFGIIFISQMQIEYDGRYEFYLTSDDGSRLWIGEEEIINNDSIHRMRNVTDTINLRVGSYPIKLWYFQGMVGEHGLIFNSRYISPIIEEKIEINSELIFTENSAKLDKDSEKYLIEKISNLSTGSIKKIEIHGHTCSDGNDVSNMKLSQQRAKSVESLLKKTYPNLTVETKAHGESLPKYDNTNVETKPKNRRIELVVKY